MQSIRALFNAISYPIRLLSRMPVNLVSSPRRILGISLPARAGICVFLICCLLTALWSYSQYDKESETNFGITFWNRIGVISLLSIGMSVGVWYWLKLWIEGEPSRFPEIDAVFEAALKSMREESIDPSDVPICLVLGPSSTQETSRFITASKIDHVVREQGPIHIYANRDAIYVLCAKSCCVGTLLGEVTSSPASPSQRAHGGETMQWSGGTLSDEYSTIAQQSGGTLQGDGGGTFAEIPSPKSPGRGDAASPAGPPDYSGTIDIGAISVEKGLAQDRAPVAAVELMPESAEYAAAALAHVCKQLCRIRGTICPINGVLVATPFKSLSDESVDRQKRRLRGLVAALKTDLGTIRSCTRVRCGVTHVINGMEDDAGFRELIRRVGKGPSEKQRFGKGMPDLWCDPVREQVNALARHASGAFEDACYVLFQQQDELQKRGNRLLYRLLCHIRMGFTDRLSSLLQNSYSIDPQSSALVGREPLLFAGCYFAADGRSAEQQAFLAGVFDKLLEKHSSLEWGSEAIREEERMQRFIQILVVLDGILVAAIAAMLVKHFWFN